MDNNFLDTYLLGRILSKLSGDQSKTLSYKIINAIGYIIVFGFLGLMLLGHYL